MMMIVRFFLLSSCRPRTKEEEDHYDVASFPWWLSAPSSLCLPRTPPQPQGTETILQPWFLSRSSLSGELEIPTDPKFFLSHPHPGAKPWTILHPQTALPSFFASLLLGVLPAVLPAGDIFVRDRVRKVWMWHPKPQVPSADAVKIVTPLPPKFAHLLSHSPSSFSKNARIVPPNPHLVNPIGFGRLTFHNSALKNSRPNSQKLQ